MSFFRSIGIFTHAELPGEIRLAHGCNISLENMDYPEAREFFETVSSHVLPSEMGGQFDIFAPLAASGKTVLNCICANVCDM
jgi:hypothetical protein